MRINHWWHKGELSNGVRVSGVRAIYLNNLLRSLGYSMVGIFFPVYVFLYGFEIGGVWTGVKVVILSMIIERLGVLLFSVPLGKLVYRIGFKYSIFVSAIATATWFLIPAIFPRSIGVIVAMAVVSSIEIPIYWLSRLSIMAMDGEKSGYGKEVSLLSLIDQGSSILGPFVGGVILMNYGFGTLFTTTTFICILSSIPIFFMNNFQIKDGISLRGFIDWLFDKRLRHIHVSQFGQGWANFVDAYLWPLFIYTMVGSFTTMGSITSVAFAISSVAILVAGRVFDKYRALGKDEDEKEYSVATILLAMVSFGRVFFRSIYGVFGVNVFFRITLPFWGVGYESYLYSTAKRSRSALEFFTYREITYSFARILGPVILLLFVGSSYFWYAVFFMGSIGTLLTVGMQKES